MPSFTIESTYRLPVFRHRTYEAATAEDACRLAIADEDWTGQKEDYENSGATYLTGIWRGVDSAYIAPAQMPVRRSEEHTSELQSLMRISSAVYCLKKKK